MPKQEIEKRRLMCRLTEEELELESKKLTEMLQAKSALEDQKASTMKFYSDQIKAKDVEIEKQIPIVHNREIEREVEVRIEYNTPEPGRKTIIRLDTMETVAVIQMTDSECQDLFINQEHQEHQEQPARPALPAPEENIIEAEEVDQSDQSEVCCKCGKAEPDVILYHVDREKPLCPSCLDAKNQKNLEIIEKALDKKQPILMRVQFGYGCSDDKQDTSCFRFNITPTKPMQDGKYTSWGTPIYLRGNYQTPQSEAGHYYQDLLAAGVKES